MPEGPEVLIDTTWLRLNFINYKLLNIRHDVVSRYNKEKIENLDTLRRILPLTIIDICNRGKLIIFVLEQGWYITSNLAMSGDWTLQPTKHSNLWLELKSKVQCHLESMILLLFFDDQRHMGRLNIFDYNGLQEKFKVVGPDLLAHKVGSFNQNLNPIYPNLLEIWHTKLLNPRLKETNIVDFLTDQKHFSGLGNYLRAEILYQARISPFRKLQDLSEIDRINLLIICMNVLEKAYNAGGKTFSTYRNPFQQTGKFETIIYDNSSGTDPYGNPIIVSPTKTEQKIRWCPAIQS